MKWGLILLLASGCALIRPRPPDPGLTLLAPGEAGFSKSLAQGIVLSKGDRSVEALALVEVDAHLVKLAALSPLGTRVFSLIWDGKHLAVEKDPSLPSEFPVEWVLRDLQLAYWEEGAVRRALPSGWVLQADSHQRIFLEGGKEVVVIRFWGDRFADPVEFEHKALGYRLKIEQVQQSQ